jgi:hypothetical protein
MADGDEDSNCQQRGWWQYQRGWLMATQQRWWRQWYDGNRNGNGQWQWQWATATAMATELATTMEMVTAIAMVTATVRAMMTKAGLPLHVPAMCSAMAGATPCLHPHGHKGKCIHQRCTMGVKLLRVFPPFQGGGFLTAHHGFFFCLLFTTCCNYCSVY